MENEAVKGDPQIRTLTLFGQRVRDLRRSKGWTQNELVARLASYGVEMHQTTLTKLEGGTRPSTIHELWALAGALECDFDHLMPPPPGAGREQLEQAVRAVEIAQLQVNHCEKAFQDAQAAYAEAVQLLRNAEAARDKAGLEMLTRIGLQSRSAD